jgi:DNA-binding NarL/FixJ family response regulator
MLINAQPDMEVVGEAGGEIEGLSRALESQPDVVLLDLAMKGHGGLPTIAQIRELCPRARVVVLTAYEDVAYFRSILAAGSSGYLPKTASETELITAIQTAAQGRTFVELSLTQEVVQKSLGRGWSADRARPSGAGRLLTQREEAVLQLVALGHTNQEIASRLNLSVKSVETYRARLMNKLGLRNRAELVQYALESGILRPGRKQD